MNSSDPESARGNNNASLPLNTVNQILSECTRTLNRIEGEARMHVEELGVRWESEIRELRKELDVLRAQVKIAGIVFSRRADEVHGAGMKHEKCEGEE